jgi:hypothetical protein
MMKARKTFRLTLVAALLLANWAATGAVVAAEPGGRQTTSKSDATSSAAGEQKAAPNVVFKVAGSEPQPDRYLVNRRLLVGPWHNRPEEYEGYNGFVGWAGVARLRSGRWLVTFTSGAWHGSPPWTDEIRKDPKSRAYFDKYVWMGSEGNRYRARPDIRSPRGGRAHIMVSDDQGETWSKPKTLVDTELDDRHPTIMELDDGTLLCTFFAWALPTVDKDLNWRAHYMRSSDGGETWSQPAEPPGGGGGFGNGPAIQLADGTVIWVTDAGKLDPKLDHNVIAVYRSSDRAQTFELASVVSTDRKLHEPSVAELPGGRLVMVTRPRGEICWSDDQGRSWTRLVPTGAIIHDPHLMMMPNGVLACFGWMPGGGVRVILSPDQGRTWHGPGEGFGYAVDPSVYGYSHPMLLPDGTVYIVFQHTGGHSAADARTCAIWAMRVRIDDAADGIEVLPAPGS